MGHVVKAAWIVTILGFCFADLKDNELKQPKDCCPNECTYHLKWKTIHNTSQIYFEMNFKAVNKESWAAVGFAEKREMSGAGVVECAYESDGKYVVRASYNEGHSNKVLDNKDLGIVAGSASGRWDKGRLICNFSHVVEVNSSEPESSKVKSLNELLFILMASGKINEEGNKEKHNQTPYISCTKINLTGTARIESRDVYVMAHGIVMVLVWMVLISFATVTARYFKEDWCGGWVLFWKPVWFQVHRFLAFFSASLIVIGTLVIASSREWKYYFSIHSVLGLTVMPLVVMNILSGMLRPNIDSPLRKCYRYVHGFTGHVLHMLGLITLYFGLSHPDAHLHPWVRWIPIAFIALRITVDVVLTILNRFDSNRNSYVQLIENVASEDETWSWRYTITISYIIISFGCSLVIIVALIHSPMACP